MSAQQAERRIEGAFHVLERLDPERMAPLDSQMELKLGAMTRAMCRPGSLSDDFVKDLGFVRSYVFRDGKLHLSLMADAGIMTFTATYDAETAATPAPQATPQG